MRHKEVKQLEFLRRQVYCLAIYLHQPPRRIKFNFSNSDGGGIVRLRRGCAAHGGAKPGRQLPNVKGLGDVVVRSGVQRLDLVLFRVLHGQHNDLEQRHELTDLPTSLNAIHAWHPDVQQHGVKVNRANQRESLLAGFGLGDFKIHTLKRFP